MNSSESIHDIVRLARGERPSSLDSQEAEEVLAVTLALVVELSVANDRIDRLERLVSEMRGESLQSVREFPLSEEAEAERAEATEALISRAMRIFFDNREHSPRA